MGTTRQVLDKRLLICYNMHNIADAGGDAGGKNGPQNADLEEIWSEIDFLLEKVDIIESEMDLLIERIEILQRGNRLEQKRIASLEERATKQELLVQGIISVMSILDGF